MMGERFGIRFEVEDGFRGEWSIWTRRLCDRACADSPGRRESGDGRRLTRSMNDGGTVVGLCAFHSEKGLLRFARTIF